jgi:GntR family transcriptional regulator, transcriptional repressor for pyruvate dehydrogenase complex
MTQISEFRRPERTIEGSGEQVISFVRDLIEQGRVGPGDRLPAERDLAAQIGVSRPTVRAGLHALAAMGVVQSRHGSGTFIPDGPPSLVGGPLSFLAALHGFRPEEMSEARRIMEVGVAGLAAERATPEQIAMLADEVASLFASLDDAQVFLVHDVNFHRSVAAASGNAIMRAVVEMVSTLYYDRRRETARRASAADLRDAAEAHRRIYQAIRARDADGARREMNEHLMQASQYQAQEPAGPADGAADHPAEPPAAPKRRRRHAS